MKKIYRSEKVIKELKAEAQLKAEVKVNVTCLNKEVLENNHRSLKDVHDKPPSTKISQQRDNNVLPDSTVENEHHCSTTVDENISTHLNDSINNNDDDKDKDKQEPTQNNHINSSCINSSRAHHFPANSSSSKSRSFFDSFCPNLFFENIQNLQKTNKIVKREVDKHPYRPPRQKIPTPKDIKHNSPHRNVSNDVDSQRDENIRKRIFPQKNISDSNVRSLITSNISFKQKESSANTDSMNSEMTNTVSHVIKPFNRSSIDEESNHPRSLKFEHLSAKSHDSKDIKVKQIDKQPDKQIDNGLKIDCEISNSTANNSSSDISLADNLLPLKPVSTTCNKIKANISPKSLKFLKQNSSILKRSFVRRFERNSKQDTSQRILKRKHLLLKIKLPIKSHMSLALSKDETTAHEVGITNSTFAPSASSAKEESKTIFREEDDAKDRNKHRDCDSDDTDICDYDDQLEERHHPKTRRLRVDNPKNECRMGEEEKSDSRSELGSDGSYDTTDEELKTRRLAVLSLLPSKTTHQISSKVSDSSVRNGEDATRNISINSLSLTDSILKLGGKRVNKEAITELQNLKKKQRKIQKIEQTDTANEQSKEKRWLRHRKKLYYESELKEIKTCKKLSLMEAKSKGFLNSKTCSEDASSNQSRQNNEMESSDSSKSCHSNNKPETAKNNNDNNIINNRDAVKSKSEKLLKKQSKQKGKKNNVPINDDLKRIEKPSEGKDSENDKNDWLMVDGMSRDGTGGDDGVKVGEKQIKRLKKQGRLEKSFNGGEQKIEKKEPGKVGRKRKKVNEDGNGNDPPSEKKESLQESFVLSRELGPNFNWLEHKIQQNYKNDSTDGDVPSKSMQQIDQFATTSPNNSSNISMMEVEKKSKHKEDKTEKHPKSSSTVGNVESIEDDELLTHTKHNSKKNKPSNQRDISGTDHKENSSKKDVADKNHVTTEEPETSISNEVHHTQPPQQSQANAAQKSEPLNLIDLTSDNPSDQMNSNPIYNNKFQPKDNRFHHPHQHVGESLFDQADSFSRRMGNSDGQPRFRTMSPSFDFSDPILLQEYRQKFDHYLKVKQIVDAKQREIMKLDLEKEKLKREMIILLNMQNKKSANQSVYSQPRQIGKVPIPVPSPPSIHATKLLNKQGLTSPSLPPSFLSGMNNLHGDESKMDSSSSIVQKLSSRRYFPHEVTYERHPRDGRIDYLPSQSNRHDEVNHTLGDADHPPTKSISVQSTNDINHEFPFTHIDQFYNDSQSNGFKIPPTRHPESTYGLRDVPPAKPFTSQTLSMCYNVHKEFLEQAKKLTPNFKSPQILFQTLPASDIRHLGGKLSPSSPADGIQNISTPAASSPDVIITNASIRTLQGEKFVETSRELNFERARQDCILYKRCQNETLRNSPPLKIPRPSKAAESKASPIKQIDDKIDDQENDIGVIDEKLALDLSMKPPQEQSKDEVMAGSEVVEDDKICAETQVLDLSIPINLKVSNKDELGIPAHIVQHTSENSNHESQLNPISDKIRAIDKSNVSKSPSVSHQDESSHLPASMVPYNTHNFPEWMDNKESEKIANSTEFNLDRSSINKDEEEFVESDKKSDDSCGSETPLTIADEVDALVKQVQTVDDKTSVIHSDENYNVFSSSDNYQSIINNNNDNIINNIFNESKFKVSNNRPNSCGDFLHIRAQKCVSPTLQSRSRSANIPLVASNMTSVKSSLSDAKETTFNYYEELPIKKDFETKQFEEEISPMIDHHHHHHHHELEMESKVKAHESYEDEDETLLNLSLKPKPVETLLPPSSTSSSRPSSLEDQTPAVLSDETKAVEKLPSRNSAQNDDEITSKNSMMMMMMMMMGQSASSIDRKPEMLSLDSEKFNAHLDETIKKELQTGEKDHIPDSIDLSSSLKSSDGRTAKSISQDKSSNESERNVEDPGYRFPTQVIKPHPSPSPLIISHEENPLHNLRHSTNPQKEHSTKAETSYYRQSLPQQTSCGPPFIPPIIQQPSNQHPIVQHHQQSYQGKQQHKIMQLQHHQMMQHQQQLEQLQRSRKSSPVSRTRHPSSPVSTKHSKSYFRSDVDHLRHSDVKNGNSVVSKLEKFTMADQTSRKQPSDVLPKRHYPETDAAQIPYYTSPQHVRLQHYQQLQQAYGAQSSLRSYSPPIRTSQRAHDIHQLQLEHQRRFQQKGIKYPIPLLAQSSQLVHQLNNPDSRDPQTYSKPISSSRYKPQTNNFTHEVRGYPGIGPSKESLSPTGFSVLSKSLRHPDSLDPSLYTKLPVLPKHFIETPKPQAHDPILKSYPSEVDTYITRYHHKQPRKIEPHVEAVDRYDSVLMRGARHPGYSKTLNDAPRVYDHGYRSTLGSEIDRRGISLRGTTSSSPHLPMVPPSATREVLTHNNKLPEEPYCFNCFKLAHFICSTCKKVSYCCKNCQAESWEKGHKDECR